MQIGIASILSKKTFVVLALSAKQTVVFLNESVIEAEEGGH